MGKITLETRRMSYEEVIGSLGERHRLVLEALRERPRSTDRKSTRLNSSHTS